MFAHPKYRFVVATRSSAKEFGQTALGRSLAQFRFPFMQVQVFEKNTLGLPKVYNQAIEMSQQHPAVLVFIHDDIHLIDHHWHERLLNALEQFDVVGLAGNKRRVPRQPGWAFVTETLMWDFPENLSGVVGHGKGFPPEVVSYFGPCLQEVKLLDGLFLACDSRKLLEHNLRFDERFDFHFYDLDFCREAEKRGLRMGTAPISVIHQSGGSFNSPAWKAGYAKYLDKWGET
jgi:GT2 family glycosyltransferase